VRLAQCVVGVLGYLAMVVLGLAPAHATHDGEVIRPVTEAEVAVSDWSGTQYDAWRAALLDPSRNPRNGLSLPAELLPPEDAARWTAVRLPDGRGRPAHQSLSDADRVQMRWYRVRAVDQLPGPHALYLPRVTAAAATVLMDGPNGWHPLWDRSMPARDGASAVLWLPLPGPASHAAELIIAVPVLDPADALVSRAWLGPLDALQEQVDSRNWMLRVLPQVVCLTLLVLGLFGLVLWLQHPRETVYALFALGAAVWTLRSLYHFVSPPAGAVARAWFWWMTHLSMAGAVAFVLIFALHFARRRPPWLERALMAVVGVLGLVSLPLWPQAMDRVLPLYLASAVMGIAGTLYVTRLAWLEATGELRLMALALWVGCALGGHDLLVMGGWAWIEHPYFMPLAALVVMISFLHEVQRRLAGTVQEALFENSQLQISLEAQTEAMREQHARLREAEQQQALLLERQRLMADMHDGLGSSLLSALVAVEQGQMSQEKVVEVLRECVDDLRLVIDSLEPIGHDLVSLLATMRYRLGKRLQVGGLKLEWDVQDLPPLAWLEPPDALHVLRLLQEALNNVLKHAQASRVRIVTRDHGSYVEIRVEDDGAGFDAETFQQGRGLRSQQRRAQHLGGKLRVDSSPGLGTRLALRLPVERPPKDAGKRQPPRAQGQL
jgi:signal transduction histidine kinase